MSGPAVSPYPDRVAEIDDFWVQLDKLSETAGLLRREHDNVDRQLGEMKRQFTVIDQDWISPAGATFPPLVSTFTPAMQELCELLLESARRMDAAHRTYLDVEQANHDNLQGQQNPLR
jgi:WXG100 family type VII secretion target